MGTTTRQIEAHIEQTREALSTNLEELEQKVKTVADWRHHVQTKPALLLGIAFAGGVMLAGVFRGRSNRLENRSSSASVGSAPSMLAARRTEAASQPWGKVKSALVAAATARLLTYAADGFPGLRGRA